MPSAAQNFDFSTQGKEDHSPGARALKTKVSEREKFGFSLSWRFSQNRSATFFFYMPLLYKMTLAGILKGFAGSAAIEFPSEAALARARQVTYGIR